MASGYRTIGERQNCHSQQMQMNKHNLYLPFQTLRDVQNDQFTSFFSPKTGIYTSKHASIQLPNDPFLDVVSFIFSHKHRGISALVDSPSGSIISYTQLPEFVKSVASGLNEFGLRQGQVVLLLLPNTIYFPIIYLAVISLGAIVTAMTPLSSTAEIKKRMDECNACLVFSVLECVKKMEEFGVPVVVVPEGGSIDMCSSVSSSSSFSRLMSSNPKFAPRPIIKQSDTAAILYSSGTSGVSKGVVITHGNLIAAIVLFIRFGASQLGYPPGWENVYLAAIPMYHVFGLTLFATGLLSLGSTIVVMRRFNMDEMARAIDRFGVTHIPVVPPLLAALVRTKHASSSDFSSLKQVTCGAAPLSNKAIQEFLENFPHVDFIQGYGMTESTAVGTFGFNTEKIRKYTSVGLLAPNMEARVVDCDTGSNLPPGRGGELWLRGPGIMKGYLNDKGEALLTVDKEGWLHTGDIVHFDEDGYLYVVDRLKEMIKYKGFQIAPADLEDVIISHPDIIDVAVSASTNENLEEIPVAFVVRRPGSELSPTNIINYVSAKVAPYKKVRKVVFINSIPRSPAGKIFRRQLRNFVVSRM